MSDQAIFLTWASICALGAIESIVAFVWRGWCWEALFVAFFSTFIVLWGRLAEEVRS